MGADSAGVLESVAAIADRWRAERSERQARRNLERADFDELRDAGFLLLPVPEDQGGAWRDLTTSVRPICEALRILAGADSSVALVSSMHPAVLAFWLATPEGDEPGWADQRRAVFASAAAGEQWGTITSEPGSGGDIARTRTLAIGATDVEPIVPGRGYLLTGDKHFGSGSGIADRMMTTGLPDGEGEPRIFVLDTRDRSWDGSAGMKLIAEWDGMGMAATQSHAMRLESMPGIRFGTDRPLPEVARAATPIVAPLFVSVVLGVFDAAIGLARSQLAGKADDLRAYERVEWARAEQDHWMAQQAYEGALRAVEGGDAVVAIHAVQRAKQGIADLAEQSLLRLTRVLGGGTYSARSPFARWFEDVRALGFLRPPWGLAYDQLFGSSFEVAP